MKNEVKEVRKKSFAMGFLSDYKKTNKRQFIIILVILFMWFLTICYLVYVLNDTNTIETTKVEQSEAQNNNYIGNDGVINNGNSKDN